MLDSEQCMRTFLDLIATEPEIARIPIMIDSSKWSVLEAGLKCVQGKAIVNSISLKEGEDEFRQQAREVREHQANTDDGPPMMSFEALTLAPFDLRLLEPSLLTPPEAVWIDSYHERVFRELSPRLQEQDAAWLRQATRPIARCRL